MTSQAKSLEVFQDLVLRGPAGARPALRRVLIDHASTPWRHAVSEEGKLSTDAGTDGDVLVFHRQAGDDLAAAYLVLWSRPGGYEVTNIVPRDVPELGYARYNALLQDFIRRIASPASKIAGFTIEATAAEQSLDDWLPPDAAAALGRFSATANKATGSAHPSDRQRWFEFLLKAHTARGAFGTDYLARWLIEVEGWPDEKAHDLVIQYEFGLALLDAYDRSRQ
jgi:hypothetical protein